MPPTDLIKLVSIYYSRQNATLGPILISLGELIKTKDIDGDKLETVCRKQKQLSQVTDMIHAAHVFHRCVKEENPAKTKTSLPTIMSLLVGDYLLAQSSVDMADLRYPKTVDLVARGLEDYAHGEFLKLKLFECCDTILSSGKLSKGLAEYARLTCGSLLSNACLSTALLAGYRAAQSKDAKDLSNIVYWFGQSTGSAQRLIELIYQPDMNSETDNEIISTIDKATIDNYINEHLDRSKSLLLSLPDGDQRPVLLKTLENMRSNCSTN